MKIGWGSWKGWLGLAAIVGIIAAVAIPSYGDYTHRAQASEAVLLLADAKTPLAEYYAEHRKWPKALGEVAGQTQGKYTQSVVISKGAGGSGEIELTATMRTERVDRRVAGQSVRLWSKNGGMNWTCAPGSMEAKNLPQACRQ